MREVFADPAGVLRWRDSGDEAAFFGVNYVAPFAYTRRALGYVGADPRTTIRSDVRHLARLGLNALRLHVWEVEVSDGDGNLIDTEALRLLDVLIEACRERGIYLLLTPIRWGENGYPEADVPLGGFSERFPKSQMGRDPAAIAASARFLAQFAHRYKDEPALVALELLNEPWSPPADALVRYVETLADAVRATGFRKPLLYNASQGSYPAQVAALGAARIDGVTFGWYPSGLVAGRTLSGNFLPAIDTYPLLRNPAFDRKIKAVYEFDAADLGSGCLYPAFARTFRSGGAQWATQFAYCPLPLAGSNTPYPTHFVNLVHAPRQAMALMVAAEAFRRLPRERDFGRYPDNTRFDAFRVRYRPDLSEMVTQTALLHAGDTDTKPPRPDALERIAAHGSSPTVEYEGAGAYFLDRLAPGAWRLEVYPDAVLVDDPHGAPRLDRVASRILWREWPMTVRLPDLGERFTVEPRDPGNGLRTSARRGRFPVRPGVYLLRRPDAPSPPVPDPELIAPRPAPAPPQVVHRPGPSRRIEATVAADAPPASVTLRVAGKSLPMRRVRGHVWSATIPGSDPLDYTIAVDGASFPGAPETSLLDRSLRLDGPQELPVRTPRTDHPSGDALLVTASGAGSLGIALLDGDRTIASVDVALTPDRATHRIPLSALRPGSGWVLLRHPLSRTLTALRLTPAGGPVAVDRIAFGPRETAWRTLSAALLDPARDLPESSWLASRGADGRASLRDAALVLEMGRAGRGAQLSWRVALEGRRIERRAALLVDARSLTGRPERLTLALIDENGAVRGASLTVAPDAAPTRVPLAALKPRTLIPVPMPYPTFPDAFQPPPPPPGRALDTTRLDALQIVLHADVPAAVSIRSVSLTDTR